MSNALMFYAACGALLVLVVLFFGFVKAETKIGDRAVPPVIVYTLTFAMIFALWPYALLRLLMGGGRDSLDWRNDARPPSKDQHRKQKGD